MEDLVLKQLELIKGYLDNIDVDDINDWVAEDQERAETLLDGLRLLEDALTHQC